MRKPPSDDLPSLRHRVGLLRRVGDRAVTMNRYLTEIVTTARNKAEALERSGSKSESLPYYKVIEQAYEEAARVGPTDDSATYEDMARFWKIAADTKQRSTTPPIQQRAVLPEVSRTDLNLPRSGTDSWRRGSTLGDQDLIRRSKNAAFKKRR